MSVMTSEIHLHQTEFFIDQNPSIVRCLRRTKTSTGTGGTTQGAEVDSGERVVRVVGQGGQTIPRTTTNGETVVPDGVAISMPGQDWQVGDRFLHNGKKHEVVFINLLPPWRMRLETIVHA